MAINNAMRAALRAIAYLDIDVKKTYKVERQLENFSSRLQRRPANFDIRDEMIDAGDHGVCIRIFSQRAETQGGRSDKPAILDPADLRVMVFFHGGGWVTGNVERYTAVCAHLAEATGHTIISVDYRLAPEHRFPAAPDDCYAITRELFAGRIIPGLKPENITLIGDSAGGNLAAVVSLMARDRGEFLPRRQILLYPATFNDHSDKSPFPSVRDNGTDYILTSRRIRKMMDMYKSSPADLNNPYFAPLLEKDLRRQPATLVISAEYCPLRDEGEYYGERLKQAGNPAEIFRMKDALHAFMMLPPRFVHVRRAYSVINNFLKREQESR